MTIYLYDGSTLECGKIEIGFDGIIADEYRLIQLDEIRMILAD